MDDKPVPGSTARSIHPGDPDHPATQVKNATKKARIATFQMRVTLHGSDPVLSGPTTMTIEDIVKDALTARGYDATVSAMRTDR